MDDKNINNIAKTQIAQKRQIEDIEGRIVCLNSDMNLLSQINDKNNDDLDKLLSMAQEMMNQNSISMDNLFDSVKTDVKTFVNKKECIDESQIHYYDPLEKINIDDACSWEEYLDNVESYILENKIELTENPLDQLFTQQQKIDLIKEINEKYKIQKDEAKCDFSDYMIATFSGLVAGFIDVIFVKMPTNYKTKGLFEKGTQINQSKLGTWTNEETDVFVIKFTNLLIKIENKKNSKNGKQTISEATTIVSAIRYLENRFKVNYDQGTGKAAQEVFDMNLGNHHLKSLGHHPTLIGLVFSILDQLNGTSHFVDDGRMVISNTQKQLNYDGPFSFVKCIFLGFSNWFGHLLSDVAGSSSSRAGEGYGSGLASSCFELLSVMGFGKINFGTNYSKNETYSISDFSVKMFEYGYDFRFSMACNIPVIVNELLLRFIFGLKCHFRDHLPWKECLFAKKNSKLRKLTLIGTGTLCIIDAMGATNEATKASVVPEAAVMAFALNLNLPAWRLLVNRSIREIILLMKKECLDIELLEKDITKEWNSLLENNNSIVI